MNLSADIVPPFVSVLWWYSLLSPSHPSMLRFTSLFFPNLFLDLDAFLDLLTWFDFKTRSPPIRVVQLLMQSSSGFHLKFRKLDIKRPLLFNAKKSSLKPHSLFPLIFPPALSVSPFLTLLVSNSLSHLPPCFFFYMQELSLYVMECGFSACIWAPLRLFHVSWQSYIMLERQYLLQIML